MSIETEIQRIKNAKKSMITALTGKGVSVPAGVQIEGLSDLIGQISTGSSGSGDTGSSGGLVLKSGTIADETTIETGLSNIKLIVIYKNTMSETGFIHGTYSETTGKMYYAYCSSYSSYLKSGATSNAVPTINGGNFTWDSTGTSGFSAGKTYNWFAVGET